MSSTSPANMKSLHAFSSLTQLGPQVTRVDPKSERTESPPPAAVSNRTVSLRSTRQPRVSYSSFAPSSEPDHPKNLKPDAAEENPPQGEEGEEASEEEKKTWNLRPRRACVGGGPSEVKKNQKPSGNRQRGIAAESPGVEVNPRLWVALSRDEIEEDLFRMSGSKPSRRPRKRAKTVQKHLDVMFPGLGLVGLNADCFRASTSLTK